MSDRRFSVVLPAVALAIASCTRPQPEPEGVAVEEASAEALQYAAAMGAHHLCSGTFVVGRETPRSAERIVAEDIAPFPDFAWQPDFTYRVDEEAKVATVEGPGIEPRSARYFGDQGCVILPPGATGVSFEPVVVPRLPEDPANVAWPTGDRDSHGEFPEVDSAKLSAALDWAMAEPQNTRALVVTYKGKIVGERYAPGFTPHTPQISWSSGKSITAALVGVLVGRGLLKVDDPAPVPEWHGEGDPRNAIRVRDLLNMSSGLDFVNEGLTGVTAFRKENEHMRIYFDALDVFEHAVDQPAQIPPGTEFRYRNSDPLTLGRIVRQIVESQGEDYLTFPFDALFNRIGARDYVLETDVHGNFIMTGYDYGSAMDWTRFGLLHLWEGVWEGTRILPEDWTDVVSAPAPGARDRQYGGLFWLNRGGAWPRVPEDAYWTAGHMGQHSVIIPSRDVVLVRLGPSPGLTSEYMNETVGRVLEAIQAN
jgi:CubicO group peptidase (beta-lactamase class C family)